MNTNTKITISGNHIDVVKTQVSISYGYIERVPRVRIKQSNPEKVKKVRLKTLKKIQSNVKKLINTKLEIQKNEQNILLDQNTIIAIKDLENKLSLIKNTRKNDFIFSQRVIDEIVLKKTPKIKITRIYYKNNSQTDNKINISGKAPGRESILFFRRILEDDTAFSKVDLPILKFVKGIYIKFNLNLIPRLNN